MPVFGIETLVVTCLFPTVTLPTLPPTVVLTDDLLWFILTPLQIEIDFLNLNPIEKSPLEIV